MFSGIRRKLTKLALPWAVALALCCVAGRGLAQPAEELQRKAATLFDRGVAEFARSQYPAAARSFLAAADVLPSREALKNALAAAQLAQEPALIAQSAARLLALPSLDGRSRREARRALGRAAPQVARVDVGCAPAPCTVRIDGESATPGVVYMSPGPHAFVASNAEGWHVAESASCEAAAQCRVALELAPAPARETPSAATEAPVASAAPPAAPSPAPPTSSDASITQEPAREPTPPVVPEETPKRRNVLALASFVGAATATAALVALVSWSGAQALSERRKYEDDPGGYDDDEVRRLARRTDYLLLGAVVSAGATAAIGLWWVDFRGRRRAAIALEPMFCTRGDPRASRFFSRADARASTRGIALVGRF